ncbi:MAG: response regulator transcription factor [Actinobacteria bacterium]|nr:response regulator transcription factor [Actinomycetota bacterium]
MRDPRGAGSAPTRRPISVLVVDDHPIVREFLSRLIESDPRLRLVAEAGDGIEALRLAEELRPDVMVLDIEMPKRDGVGVLRGLRAADLPIRVLVFTGHASEAQEREVENLRADSVVRKGDGTCVRDEIVAMVRREPSTGRHKAEGGRSVPHDPWALTERERVVLAFAAQGRSVADLAARLTVSERTAKVCRRDLCKRFGATSILGVVATATRLGLLD